MLQSFFTGKTCRWQDILVGVVHVCRCRFRSGDDQNQPLDIIVRDRAFRLTFDPRESLGGQLRIALIAENGARRILAVDLLSSAEAPPLQLDSGLPAGVTEVHGAADDLPVSIAIDMFERDATDFSGSFSKIEGAWLRLAPARQGGLLSTADHLVMDGALHGEINSELLERIAKEPGLPVPGSGAVSDGDLHAAVQSASSGWKNCLCRFFPAIQFSKTFPILTVALNGRFSTCDLIGGVGRSLEACGIRVITGRKLAVLTTLPRSGPHFQESKPRRRHRILPVLIRLDRCHCSKLLKNQIDRLNETGWNSALPQILTLYNRHEVHPFIRWWLREIIHRIPLFGLGAAHITGVAIITVPPALEVSPSAFDQLESVQVETVRPIAGPVIHMQTIRDRETGREKLFVSLSGSGRWNKQENLEQLREQVCRHLSRLAAIKAVAVQPAA